MKEYLPCVSKICFSLFSLIAGQAFGSGKSQGLTVLDLKPSYALALMNLEIGFEPDLASLPQVAALSSYVGDEGSCVDDQVLGMVCADNRAYYLDDALLQKGKEISLKPPRTGIPLIDNNRNVLEGAAAAGAVGIDPLVGAWWTNQVEAQKKIDELRRQKREAEAALAEEKLNRSRMQEDHANEQKRLLGENQCLTSRVDLKSQGINAIDSYRQVFNNCLESVTDGGQSCLDTYDKSIADLVALLNKLGGCN